MAVRASPLARRKRSQPPVCGGVPGTYEDKDNKFACPVCFKVIEEAYMTKCGHSFCHACIQQSLEHSSRCPKCNFVIDKKDDIFPNFMLSEIIIKHKASIAENKRLKFDRQSPMGEIGDLNFVDPNSLDLPHVNYMLAVLSHKKQLLEQECAIGQNELLKEFLERLQARKQEELNRLSADLSLLNNDLQKVSEKLSESKASSQSLTSLLVNGSGEDSSHARMSGSASNAIEGFNSCKTGGRQWLQTTMAARRKQIDDHFQDLEEVYFSTRQNDFIDSVGGKTGCGRDSLEEFTASLSKFSRFSGFRTLASLSYATDIYNTSSIVSSIEFDRDCDYFAIAGVTKKIKVYEYGTVIRDQVDQHYPVTEMLCNSKISSVIWSCYHKNVLASSDYEGTVTLWDAMVGSKTRVFQEHEKRCWSVDFNRTDPKLLASGSDDSKVKLWHTNVEHSVSSLEVKANVCCVKFNPESRFHLAFGSADHCIHYYDLRHTKEPLHVFKGHRKAVSYAKFLNNHEIVSASTDSQLKLWSLETKPQCLRTLKGHINEKNFVGLATDGDYIACGSENNSLYVYYKGLPKHLLTFKFDTLRNVMSEKKEDESSEFVSAVCWRENSNVVVAANSQGIIKVLELV